MVQVRAGRKLKPSVRLASLISEFMAKKTLIPEKRRGPAPTGVGKPQVVRMRDKQIAAIDAWIVMQEEDLSRPEAIRRLVELGLLAQKAPDIRYQTKANETADEARKLASELGLRTKSEKD